MRAAAAIGLAGCLTCMAVCCSTMVGLGGNAFRSLDDLVPGRSLAAQIK